MLLKIMLLKRKSAGKTLWQTHSKTTSIVADLPGASRESASTDRRGNESLDVGLRQGGLLHHLAAPWRVRQNDGNFGAVRCRLMLMIWRLG